MESPYPPTSKSRGKSNLWLIITAVVVGLVLMLGTFVGVGVFVYRRIQQDRVAKETVAAINAEKARMAESMEKGDFTQGESAIGRVREQIEKSAGQMSASDAATARAMAAFLGKMQVQARLYQGAVQRLTNDKIFTFNIPNKATLEAHRQTLRDFVAMNAQLTETISNSEALIRSELEAASLPPATIDTAIRSYLASQGNTRPLQLQIRQYDRVMGDSGLAILDLLEKTWGRWERNPQTGQLTFRDDATLNAYNQLIQKVQAASQQQAVAQKQMADFMRAKAAQK